MTQTAEPTPTHPAHACGSAHTCHGLTRRSVLRGAGTASLGAAALVLAACAGPSDGGEPADADGTGGAAPDAGSGVLAALSDVPVGGALAVKGPGDVPILLLQPTAGTVVAYSAVCTHQGCTVVADGDALVCPCHGSAFSPEDGSATNGPAEEPLAAFPVEVVDGDVVAA